MFEVVVLGLLAVAMLVVAIKLAGLLVRAGFWLLLLPFKLLFWTLALLLLIIIAGPLLAVFLSVGAPILVAAGLVLFVFFTMALILCCFFIGLMVKAVALVF